MVTLLRPNHYGGCKESSKPVQQKCRDADAEEGYKEEATRFLEPTDVWDESVSK